MSDTPKQDATVIADASGEANVTTLVQFDPINTWEGKDYKSAMIPRIICFRNTFFFDLREHRTSAEFTGFTSRGIRLKVRDAQKLLNVLPKAISALRNELSKHFAAPVDGAAVARE